MMLLLLLLEVELGAGVRREVAVLPVLRVGIGAVVEEGRRHCLSGHSVHHVSGDFAVLSARWFSTQLVERGLLQALYLPLAGVLSDGIVLSIKYIFE